jgi:thiol-disulfide isomerase/thioredoxin
MPELGARWVFSLVGVLALLAGTALWLAAKPPATTGSTATVTPGVLFASSFADTRGNPRSLGQFQGKVMVVNFWATWCAPCREEMPAFKRLQERWAGRNVQFVGLASEEPRRVERFGRDLGINYPLLVGGDEVGALSKRLGNSRGVLPHTVILDAQGRVVGGKVGPYTEAELDAQLKILAANPS